jgi:hypothetical protein
MNRYVHLLTSKVRLKRSSIILKTEMPKNADNNRISPIFTDSMLHLLRQPSAETKHIIVVTRFVSEPKKNS